MNDSISHENYEALEEELKQTKAELHYMQLYADTIVDTVNDLLITLDNELKVIQASKGFYKRFNTTEHEVIGNYFYEIKSCPWNDDRLMNLLANIIIEN